MSPVINGNLLVSLMCYEYRGPTVEYGGNSYGVNALLNDPHSGVKWYPEPHLCVVVEVHSEIVQVKGTFRHRKCKHIVVVLEPFPKSDLPYVCPNPT